MISQHSIIPIRCRKIKWKGVDEKRLITKKEEVKNISFAMQKNGGFMVNKNNREGVYIDAVVDCL